MIPKANYIAGFVKDKGARIFALAILASLLWHLFWIAAISIVSNPESANPVKFSKVSFLGPLLGNGAMELQARPKEASFLEIRYIRQVKGLPIAQERFSDLPAERYEGAGEAYHLRDTAMAGYIDDALSSEKAEPSD